MRPAHTTKIALGMAVLMLAAVYMLRVEAQQETQPQRA